MKYFLHDSNSFQDEKITLLFMHFGYEGLGLFYTILEKIAAQEKPINTTVLKKQLCIGKKLDKCWKYMEHISLICSKNGETFNDNLLKFNEKYQIKKEKNREKVSEWRKNQAVKENVTGYEPVRNAPKGKVRKGNSINNIVDSPEPTLFKSLVEYWLKIVHPGWDMDGAKGKALKSVICKIKKILEDQDKEATDDLVFQSFKAICENLPEWFQDKDLQILNSQFSTLITQIKNKRNGTLQPTPRTSVYDSAAFFRS